VRLFVAVYPPRGFVERAFGLLDGLGLPEQRVVAAEQVHLTLHFVGEVVTARVDEVRESVERSAAGLEAFEVTPERLVSLPRPVGRRGGARLVAVQADRPPGLLEIVRRLATRLATSPRRDPVDRYLPHLTLCRFRKVTDGFDLDEPIVVPPFEVRDVRLMRSVLKPSGAEHRVEATFPLGC
jgi:2'-5' RNA ligase